MRRLGRFATRRPVWVLASEAASDTMFIHDKRDLSRVEATERAAHRAYRSAGKTPAELLTGQPHPHWLEMLGYKLFTRG